MKRLLPWLGLITILAAGFAFRASGWNWDEGHLLHPDERHLLMVTAALEAPETFLEGLNGATSPFTPYNQNIHSYVYGQLPLRIVHAFSVEQGVTDLKEIMRIGRSASAWFSTGTILLLYLIGRRLHSHSLGLLAAGLQATVVLSIQLAHFFTVDSFGTFFATACVGAGLLYIKEQRLPWLILSGAMVGLAMACRVNLGLLAFWVILVSLMSTGQSRRPQPLIGLASGGLLALLLFRVLHPMAFDGWGLSERWLQDLTTVHNISRGTLEVPFTLQWVGRTPYLYALTQFGVFSIGLPLGITASVAIITFLLRSPNRLTDWRVAATLWPILMFAYHGRIFLHTQRYFDPTIPVCVLCAATLLLSMNPGRWKSVVIGGVTACTLWYALAFTSVYRQTHPRIQASEWLVEHLPFGGTVLTEHWDDALPLHMEVQGPIQRTQMEVYQPESEEKIRGIVKQIEEADYLVLSSTRASLTIPRMPERYPAMANFYNDFLKVSRQLGLQQVASFQDPLQFGGLMIPSELAEEAYRVYDHPLVRIYEKSEAFDADRLFEKLTKDVSFETIPEIRYLQASKSNAGWLSPAQEWRRGGGKPAGDLFSAASPGGRHPTIIWTILIQALYVVGFPISFYLFPLLRDRGFAVCRLLGLIVVTWLAWFPAALEILPFTTSLLIAGMLSVGGSAGLLVWKWDEIRPWFKQNGKRFVASEVVCWSVYAIFLLLRVLQPELWHPWAGGEKPMDFAFLNAATFTEYFPPENPWLSGAFINYYYYGFAMVAVLIRLTGVAPEVAYNLALPTFAFFTAGVMYTLATAMAPLFKSRSRVLVGVEAVLFTLLLGNLGQLREYLRPDFPTHPRDVYWNASRVIQVPQGEVHPITEFPFFSQLYGDLHAHLMALPIAMLCLLISWQLFRRFHPLRIAALSLVLGTLWVTNTWDLPIQAAVFAFVCLFPACRDRRWIPRGLSVIGGLLLARVLFYPFHLHFASIPLELKIWEGPRSSPLDLFLAHGLFVVPLIWGGILWFRSGKRRTTYHLLPLLLLAGCLFTIGFLEVCHLGGDIGRMNVVFKFYYQIWWILALLTALLFTSLAGKQHLAYTTVSGLLLLGGLVYPFTALPAKISEWGFTSPRGTLNGMAYLRESTLEVDGIRISLEEDYDMILWLRENAAPGSVLLEAQRPLYQWGGRISWHTGLPTVLGWDWHMRQQRPWPGGETPVFKRQMDIDRFFREADTTVLDRYQVDYVILGQLERVTYGEEAVNRLLNCPGLTPVFNSGVSIIFQFGIK